MSLRRIAILGATGQIGQGLIDELSAEAELVPFSRRLEDFSAGLYDVVINAAGPGDPKVHRQMGDDIEGVTAQLDGLVLDYLTDHPQTAYIYISTGAVHGGQTVYAKAKRSAEARHRAAPDLAISDIRVHGYFSRHMDPGGGFLLAEMLHCLLTGETFVTDGQDVLRDYVGAVDLAGLIRCWLEAGAPNGAFDIKSADPVSKLQLVAALADLGLRSEVTSETWETFDALPGNRAAEDLGYVPRTSSLDLVAAEMQAAKTEAWMGSNFPDREISRVLLVNPPDGTHELFQPEKALRRRYSNYPPYGPAVLARHLLNLGIEVRVLNLNNVILKACHAQGDVDFDGAWQEALDREISDFAPHLIGVTCMFTMTHVSLQRTVRRAAGSGVPVVIGGVHVSNDIDRVLDEIPEARAAFYQESDLALPTFIDMANGKAGVLGQVVLVDVTGRMDCKGNLRPTPEQLDVIPAYDLIDVGELSRYGVIGNFHGFRSKDTRFATLLSNRGCRGQCTFCSVRNFNGKSVRGRSVSSVLDELECLREDHGVGHVVWLDDDLLWDEARAIALFDGMVKRKLDMTWDATNGVIAASCTQAVVSAMAASGCIALNIGMETGNPEMLKRVRKPGTVKNFLAAAQVLKEFPQIHSRVFIMIGFPGETMSMIGDTMEVCRQMDLDWFAITPLQPLPNTPIYEEIMGEQRRSEDSSEVRFMSGGFGKQDDLEAGVRPDVGGFEDVFKAIPPDAVPTRSQIDDIWFYMNYHLNFRRLLHEDRPEKLTQQLKHLTALADVISPDHGFALYFTAHIQKKLFGKVEPGIVERLDAKLTASAYWRDRMLAFGLSVLDI